MLSIITVCFRAGKTLNRTIRSIARQKTPELPVEYLIVDAGSEDETLDIVRHWAGRGVVDTWISESDEGIYDGMNKAAGLASGKYLAFINSDDELAEDALAYCLDAAKDNPAYFYGNARVENPNGSLSRWIGDAKMISVSAICCHQALWVRSDVFNSLAGFHLNVGLSADYDFMWRLFLGHGNGQKINRDLAIYYIGGASDSLTSVISTYDVKVRYASEIRSLMEEDPEISNAFYRHWLSCVLSASLGHEAMNAVRSQITALGTLVVLPTRLATFDRVVVGVLLCMTRWNSVILNPIASVVSKSVLMRKGKGEQSALS